MFEPLNQLWFRVRSRFTRETLDAELHEEIKLHAEFLKEEALRSGASLDEATRKASRRLGNVTNIREYTRERWSFGWLEILLQDTKYAFRFLRRSPGFTAVAVLSLALGVGANATVFAVADRLLFSAPAGVQQSDELYQIYIKRAGMGDRPTFIPDAQFREYFALREFSNSLSAIAMYFGPSKNKIGKGPDARIVRTTTATANYFETIGVKAVRGRFFLPDDDSESATEYATVISYNFWQSYFAGADSAVGSRIQVGILTFTVVGVAPRGFSGIDLDATEMWTPMSAVSPHYYGVQWKTGQLVGPSMLVRLRDGVSTSAASTEVATIINGLPELEPSDRTQRVVRLGSVIAGKSPAEPSTELQISSKLVIASTVVLFAACANLANLLLVRALSRRREIALRLAVGVSRLRLASQMIIESLIIAFAGSGIALLLASWSGNALRALVFPELQWATSAVNVRVFVFAGLSGALIAVLATLIPAIRMTRSDVTVALRASASQLTASTGRFGRTLLAVQVALAVLLIVGASAFSSSLKHAYKTDMGIEVNRLITARYLLENDSVGTPSRMLMLQEGIRRVRTTPGIEAATIVSHPPLASGTRNNTKIRVPGNESEQFSLPFWLITPEFQRLAGFQLVRGRWMNEADVAPGLQPVVLITQTLATRLWPDSDPIGQCVRRTVDSAPCWQIAGVIRDLRPTSFRDAPTSLMFVSTATPRINSAIPGYIVMRVREGQNVDELLLPVRKVLLGVRNDIASLEVKPFSKSLDRYYRPLELGTTMFGSFAVLAIVLAALGLYGILAFSVAQRTNEFGIRSALGAQARDLVVSVVREGMTVVATGIVLGAILSWYASTAIAALLFESSARDLAPYLTATATLGLVALAASMVPAWRATRVDPATALRAE